MLLAPPQLLLRRHLIVVGEIAQEEVGQHVVAEVIRIHGPAQLVGDAPEGIAQLFLVGVGHNQNLRLVPDIAFVIFDVVFGKKNAVFILESACAVMLLLVVNVAK